MKRERTRFVKELPRGSGAIVAMVNFKDKLYVASEKGIWYLGDVKTRFVRCKFQKNTDQKSSLI